MGKQAQTSLKGKMQSKHYQSSNQPIPPKKEALEIKTKGVEHQKQLRKERTQIEKVERTITLKDAKQFGSLLSNIQAGTSELDKSVDSFLDSIKELNTENGISILDSKNKILRSYIINLLFYVSLKVQGKAVNGHPVIQRLLYLKTMLEKLRPLEQKIAYQIQKAIQASALQASSSTHAFKPRPSEFEVEEEAQEAESDDSDKEMLIPKYKAPLLNPTLTNKELARERKKKAASRKNIARSALMQEIREEMLELPEEVFDQEDKGKNLLDEEKEIQDFQSQHFKRVSLTKEHKMKIQKKRKQVREQQRALQDFDSLGLGDITAALNEKNQEEEELGHYKNLAQFMKGNSALKQRKKNPMDEEITSSQDEGIQNKRESLREMKNERKRKLEKRKGK